MADVHHRDGRDVGVRVVDRLYEAMQIDDEWALWDDRGLTWWSFRLAQRIEVGDPTEVGELETSTVRVRTDLVVDVDPATSPDELVAAVNSSGALGALVWDPERRSIEAHTTAVVHEQNEHWITTPLSVAAIVQNTAAHARCHAMAEACGGRVALGEHPEGGARRDPDEILDVPESVIAAEGEAPSVFAGEPLGLVVDTLPALGAIGSGDETSLACEVPFTGERPVAELAGTGDPIETALVQVMTGTPHPQLGNGALVVLQLPLAVEEGDAARVANELNRLEAGQDGGPPLLGAWCPAPTTDDQLAHVTFLPNALGDPVLVTNLIAYQSLRSRWTAGLLT